MRNAVILIGAAFAAGAGVALVYRLDQSGLNITVGVVLALVAALAGGLLALGAGALMLRATAPRAREDRAGAPQVPIIIVGGNPQQVPQLQQPPAWPGPAWPAPVHEADVKIVGEED